MVRVVKALRTIALALAVLLALAQEARAQSAPPPSPPDVLPIAPPVVRLPPPAIPLQLALRDQRLARDLDALGARDRNRVASGIVQLSVGAVLTTVGAVLKNEVGRSLLILVGGATMAHGGILLGLHADADGLADAYRGLPLLTPQMASERVQFGERALASIARGARRARIADGTVMVAVSAGYVPLLWWLQRREDPAYRFGDNGFDWVGVAISGINFASGLVTALLTTEAERRLTDYEALRERVTAPRASFQLTPVRAGLTLTGTLRF